ncbi:unnamed protein product [Gordionus sp. m RMFG-2023]
MGIFGQETPTRIEKRRCYWSHRRGHLANQRPHLAGEGKMWEQAVCENEIAGDNGTSIGETAVHVGEVVWPKDISTVGGWSEVEGNHDEEEVHEESDLRSN